MIGRSSTKREPYNSKDVLDVLLSEKNFDESLVKLVRNDLGSRRKGIARIS